MKVLEKITSQISKGFQKGGPLERLFPLFEALDTFAFTPGKLTQKAPYVRDSLDIKRLMTMVVVALVPCIVMGIYNTGYQILLAKGGEVSFIQCVILGLLKVLPIIVVSYAAGGFWEVLFAVVRKHEINEGFLVTGMLFALILPPSIPLWQVAVGISFGVVIGKEVFGGTGMNILNPALVGRAFLFFSYPAQISGDYIWVALDGITKATPLAVVADAPRAMAAVEALKQAGISFQDAFLGFIPGSIGETSTLACFLGLVFLLITRVANWRIISGCFLGAMLTILAFFSFRTTESIAFFSLPFYWHFTLGGFAFGSIFMATDPVSSCATDTGRWIYGFLIGMLTIVIRMLNPAYPEGMMLAILFMNVFAPLIDHFIVEINIKKRLSRVTRQ